MFLWDGLDGGKTDVTGRETKRREEKKEDVD
jgi:hypothetical protein